MIDVLLSRTVVSDGVALHLEGTARPTALMLHGLGYASWEATLLRSSLGEDFGLWSLDNRGTGKSQAHRGPVTIDQLADDAAKSIRVLGCPLIVVGHSMGGYVALALAVRHPDLVAGLVLIASSPGGDGTSPVPASTRRAWAEAVGSEPDDYARRTMPLSFRIGWSKENASEFEDILAARLEFPTSQDVWRSQFEAAERFVATGIQVDRISVPALVIHGSGDRVVPVENGRLLGSLLPASEYHEIAGAGHLVHLEEPALVSRLIHTFTARTIT